MTSEQPQQVATGAFIAQASMGSTAIAAQQLTLVLGSELSERAKADLIKYLVSAVGDLSRTVVINHNGDLIGENNRYVSVENPTLRSALASVALSGPDVPLQLPVDVVNFTNRERELDIMDRLVGDEPGALCLYGMGGSGKSALVTHFAHTRQQSFVDGILWGDLRYQSSAAVVDMFAYGYGVDLSSITDLRAKVNIVKALLMAKRALVILDNAEAAADLDLLISMSGNISMIVTTRNADTPELRGTAHVLVDTFDDEISLRHFELVLERSLDSDEELQARRLANSLGYLPLALDIGIRLAKRARLNMGAFADLLHDSSATAVLVDGGRSLSRCFHVSWDTLSRSQRLTLLSMTVLDCPSFDAAALAVMNDQSVGMVRTATGDLIASSLVILTQSGRYQLHPLVRDFISSQTIEYADDVSTIGRRAVDYYLALVKSEAAKSDSDATRWAGTRRELENVEAAWRWANLNSDQSSVMQYAMTLGQYLFERGYWDTCLDLLTQGISAADSLHDEVGELSLRLLRGELAREQGRYLIAAEDLDSCVAAGYRMGEVFKARAIRELGELRRVQRDYLEARRLHRESLALSTKAKDLRGQARSLHDCGLVERILGDFEKARQFFEQSIAASSELGMYSQEAYSRLELGIVGRTIGEYALAAELLQKALEYFGDSYDLRGQSYAHRELGELAIENGDYEQAVTEHSASLRLRKTLGDVRGEAIASYYLAYAHQCLGRRQAARTMYEAALHVSQELNDLRNIARLELRMGELDFEDGNLSGALTRWQESVAIFDRLGVAEKEAEIARGRLRDARQARGGH